MNRTGAMTMVICLPAFHSILSLSDAFVSIQKGGDGETLAETERERVVTGS